RLAKEKVMYEKEVKQQEEKIEKMKAEACDDYGIKKQVKICILRTTKPGKKYPTLSTSPPQNVGAGQREKLAICFNKVEPFFLGNSLFHLLENEKELEDAEEYKEARSILESVKLEA
ncbi:TBCA protein, partial [Chloroceryle aenea]|nr:TBCA protein [Chloroceryle aenea]